MPALPDNSCESHNDFLENEYCNLQNLIYKYDVAISAIITGGHSSYELDTGQSRQQVTRHNISSIQLAREAAMAELSTLAARLRKSAAVRQVIPTW